jgi:hypothetical protein
MLKHLFAFLIALGLCGPALAANTTLGNLAAGGSIAGTDLFYDVQTVGSGGVKVTGTQLSTFIWGTGGATVAGGLATFANSTLLLKGSSTGVTMFTSANAGASNFTLTFPAVTASLNYLVGTATSGDCVKFSGTAGGITDAGAVCAAGGGTPGGATTNVQFNNSSAFGGDAGFTYAGNGQATLALGTITTNLKALTITGTWNNAAVVFDAPIFQNITNTASANGSLLFDFQIGGNTVVGYQINGTYHSISVGAGALVLDNAVAGSTPLIIAPGGGGFGTEFQNGGNTYTFDSTIVLVGGVLFGNSNQVRTLNVSQDSASTVKITTTAQTATGLNVYNLIDANQFGGGPPTANYERVILDFTTTTNVATIGTQAGGSGTLRNVALVGALITIPGIGSDATHTDASICEDTTTHALYSGSGTLGICLGTSSLRFKHDVAPLNVGLKQIMALQPIIYRMNADRGDPNKDFYGFSAEQGLKALPKLVGNDEHGDPATFDYMGVVPVLVKAMQEQQHEIEHLKARLH